jgi:NADH:ubiquinone reductase (H+-translocating)
VTDIQKGRVRLGGETIEAGTILWTAGVAAVSLAKSLGAPFDALGRVKVNTDLTVPGHPEVYVIGDMGTLAGADGQPLPGVIQVALQQGRLAARNILATTAGQPRASFAYHDLGTMATIGRHSAVCDLKWIKLQGQPAWWAWLLLHIYKLIGFRNRLTVMTQWAYSYWTHQRSVRLILGGR